MTRIRFNEVVTRDGFQAESRFVETERKVQLIDQLSCCGYAKIEVTSFTSSRAIPMLRDAEEVMVRIRREPGVIYSVLVPNIRGAERALSARADELNLVMSVSESHNVANLRMSCADSFSALSEVIRLAQGRAAINVSLSCSFGCPMEGPVEGQQVVHWARKFADLGVQSITICDTTGLAHPGQVRRLTSILHQALISTTLALHFHDTRGMGLANLLAAVQAGVCCFDGSLGGIGGCPFAPGAAGNICSEDAIHMLHAMGYETGVDLRRLTDLAGLLPDIVGHAVLGHVSRAGLISDPRPTPARRELADNLATTRGRHEANVP